jgi:hypothetical protein
MLFFLQAVRSAPCKRGFGLQDCQQSVDQLFLVSVAAPILVLVAFLAWKLRPVPQTEGSNFFEDSETGLIRLRTH